MRVEPHIFQVFEGDDEHNPTTWCKWCNSTREEGNALGLHVEWGIDEQSGEYFIENASGKRVAEGLTFQEAITRTQGV